MQTLATARPPLKCNCRLNIGVELLITHNTNPVHGCIAEPPSIPTRSPVSSSNSKSYLRNFRWVRSGGDKLATHSMGNYRLRIGELDTIYMYHLMHAPFSVKCRQISGDQPTVGELIPSSFKRFRMIYKCTVAWE